VLSFLGAGHASGSLVVLERLWNVQREPISQKHRGRIPTGRSRPQAAIPPATWFLSLREKILIEEWIQTGEMERSDPPTDGSSALRPTGFGRREVLAATGVALTGCTALGGASYGRDDIDLSLDVACAGDDSDEKIVTLSWEWANENGGSDPPDLATIYWDERKWVLVESNEGTSEAVRYVGPGGRGGMKGVMYRHDDAVADAGTSYTASCRLAPTGEFTADVRNVFGEFIHQPTDGPEREDSTSEPRKVAGEWEVAVYSDAAAAPCKGDSS